MQCHNVGTTQQLGEIYVASAQGFLDHSLGPHRIMIDEFSLEGAASLGNLAPDAAQALIDMRARHDDAGPQAADIIVALGGDGFML